MARIVFVTDSASDLDPAVAKAHGIRVPPRITRLVVSPVRITATAPKNGPKSISRWWPIRSDRTPKNGERTSSLT